MEHYQINQEYSKGSGRNRPVISTHCKIFIGINLKEAHGKYSKTKRGMDLQNPAESQFIVTPQIRGTKWAAHLLSLSFLQSLHSKYTWARFQPRL